MKLAQTTPELPVRNVKAAQAYYVEKLGFAEAWYHEEGRIGAAHHGDCAIFLREAGGPIHPCVHWIYSEDVDAYFKDISARGADIVRPPQNTSYGLRAFTFRDLNGHIFHVHRELAD